MIHVHRNDKNAKIKNILELLDLSNIELVHKKLINVYNNHQDKDEIDTNRLKFELVGVTVHSGENISSGHYFIYQKRSNGKWYNINDNQVNQIDDNVFDIVKNEIATSSTLLVYKLKS